jgi:dihydrofolate synthase/folylpolyglutamate synthase
VAGDPLEYLFGLEHFGIKFGLENVRALLASLDHPERAFRSIHIAGTNGKGSVTAIVDSALRRSGIRCGRYTSPHILDISERFVIDGTPVSRSDLRDVIELLRTQVDRLRGEGVLEVHPTFFEVTTAAAFELFRRANVEVAVCEVGLGGRLDATNVLQPAVTAITSIAHDHEQYLGYTLAEIAREKAGIIKPRTPVVIGLLDPEADAVVVRIAAEQSAPLIRATDGASAVSTSTRSRQDDTGGRGRTDRLVGLRTPVHDYGEIPFALAGDHQLANLLIAVRTLETFAERERRVTFAAIERGIAEVRWPGRLERIVTAEGNEALLDAAHNPAGAAALASYLTMLNAEAGEDRRPLVFAAMRDKDVDGILRALLPVVSAIVVTRATPARSADPQSLADAARRIAPTVEVQVAATARDALAAAWRRSPRIVVAGSIFLLGDVIEALTAP